MCIIAIADSEVQIGSEEHSIIPRAMNTIECVFSREEMGFGW